MSRTEWRWQQSIGPIKDQVAHSAKIGQVTPGSTIHGFTRVLAQQTAARGITVNAISSGYVPGAVATQTGTKNNTKVNIDKSRLCSALDIARGVQFLVAENADFITGSTLSIIDGRQIKRSSIYP